MAVDVTAAFIVSRYLDQFKHTDRRCLSCCSVPTLIQCERELNWHKHLYVILNFSTGFQAVRHPAERP